MSTHTHVTDQKKHFFGLVCYIKHYYPEATSLVEKFVKVARGVTV